MFVTICAALALSIQQGHHRTHGRMHGHQKPVVVDETAGIKAGYADVKRAFETKNWALFRSRCTSNFEEELPNHKKMNLKQALAQLRQEFAPLTDIKVSFDLQDVKVNGNTATVVGRYSGDGKFKDKKGSHKMHSEGSETDSLKKVRGRWVAYYVLIHDQSTSIDGHVVSHMP